MDKEVYTILERLEEKITARFDRLEDKMNKTFVPRIEIEKEFARLDSDIRDFKDEFNASQRKIIGITSSISSILASAITLLIANMLK